MRSRSGTVRRIAAFHPTDKLASLQNGGLMDWDELYETAAAIVAGRQGDPGRRRVHGDDQEAVRRDRRRVDRGDAPRLPQPALHDSGHGGVHRRRDPVRRDDPAVRRRRHTVRRSARREGSRAGDQGRHRREAAGAPPGRDGHRGTRRSPRAARRVLRARGAVRQMAGGDHDRRRHPDRRRVSTRTRTRWRATPRSARRPGSSRSSSRRC